MRRGLAWTLGVIVLLVITFVTLDLTFLLTPINASGSSSEAPTFACGNRGIAEGFTYKFRDPRRGELVVFHASGHLGGTVTPDPDARDLGVVKRVAGLPGDQVEAHGGRVYVDGIKFDDIATKSFRRVDVGADEYFVLGDNRSFSQDSRDFGLVPRAAIYGRVILVIWPLRHFGGLPSRKAGPPPGPGYCD
jgi:signal peptidase I